MLLSGIGGGSCPRAAAAAPSPLDHFAGWGGLIVIGSPVRPITTIDTPIAINLLPITITHTVRVTLRWWDGLAS